MKELNRFIPGELVIQTSQVVNWVKKIFPYGSVFLLFLCIKKIPIFQGYWRLYLSIRLSQLFLLLIL